MGVIIGTLHKKSILRDTSGNIISWLDETDGGWIIKNRQIVNQAKYDSYVKKEHDKQIAAKAASEQAISPNSEVRNGVSHETKENPKLEELEKKVNGMDDKLNAILKAIKKSL